MSSVEFEYNELVQYIRIAAPVYQGSCMHCVYTVGLVSKPSVERATHEAVECYGSKATVLPQSTQTQSASPRRRFSRRRRRPTRFRSPRLLHWYVFWRSFKRHSSSQKTRRAATDCHLPYGITQCYLPFVLHRRTRPIVILAIHAGRYTRRYGIRRIYLGVGYMPIWFTCPRTVTHPSSNYEHFIVTWPVVEHTRLIDRKFNTNIPLQYQATCAVQREGGEGGKPR